MDLASRAELNTALLAVALAGLAGIALLVKQVFSYISLALQAKIDALQKQVNDNHADILHLKNGGGDEKIDNRLRNLGVIPPLFHGGNKGRRSTDSASGTGTQTNTNGGNDTNGSDKDNEG